MKQLIIMRHAKSSWTEHQQPDFDRTLNERGKRDAPEMGKRIKKKGFSPDLVISSPAVRALTTAKAVAQELHYDEKEILFERAIYDAEIEDLLHVIRAIEDTADHVLMVGHNPGLTSLVGYLSNQFIEHLPTSGTALITFDISSWHLAGKQTGTLAWFDFPKNTD